MSDANAIAATPTSSFVAIDRVMASSSATKRQDGRIHPGQHAGIVAAGPCSTLGPGWLVASRLSRNARKSCCMCGGGGANVANWQVKSYIGLARRSRRDCCAARSSPSDPPFDQAASSDAARASASMNASLMPWAVRWDPSGSPHHRRAPSQGRTIAGSSCGPRRSPPIAPHAAPAAVDPPPSASIRAPSGRGPRCRCGPRGTFASARARRSESARRAWGSSRPPGVHERTLRCRWRRSR